MRKLPIVRRTLRLAGDYEGWEVTVRTNPPLGCLLALQENQSFRELLRYLATIILDWNFVDEEGQPLGPPTEETLAKLPSDLIWAILEQYNQEVASLGPKRVEISQRPPG